MQRPKKNVRNYKHLRRRLLRKVVAAVVVERSKKRAMKNFFFATELAFALIKVLLFAYILMYLQKLEKSGCECAMSDQRKFIVVYFYLALAHIVLLFVMGIAASEKVRNTYVAVTSVAWFVLTVVYLVQAWQYMRKLLSPACTCAKAVARDIFFVLVVIQTLLTIVTIFGITMAAVAIVRMNKMGSSSRGMDALSSRKATAKLRAR